MDSRSAKMLICERITSRYANNAARARQRGFERFGERTILQESPMVRRRRERQNCSKDGGSQGEGHRVSFHCSGRRTNSMKWESIKRNSRERKLNFNVGVFLDSGRSQRKPTFKVPCSFYIGASNDDSCAAMCRNTPRRRALHKMMEES